MRAYERLLSYARFDTASDENNPACPSTDKQLVFAAALVEEMKKIGIADAFVDEHGYVYGTIPASDGCGGPALGYIAHMDVVSEVTSANIQTHLVENYDGNDILLNAEKQIWLKVSDSPQLKDYIGKTLIVTDGTTLLGADDKAGIADILTFAEYLIAHPEEKHGKICIGFTPDEEIGRGADLFNVPLFGAKYAYTLDGGTFGEVEYENFNASSAVVRVSGVSTHTGAAKNRMINAQEIAIEFHQLLPAAEKPMYTEKYEGFYHLAEMSGRLEEAQLHYLLRDHDADKLRAREAHMLRCAQLINDRFGRELVKVDIRQSYRNMAEVIRPHRHLIDNAYDAVRQVGGKPFSVPVRGGTDGARLSYMGLPCPNLGTGAHNAHGRMEYAVVEEMDDCVRMLLALAKKYAE